MSKAGLTCSTEDLLQDAGPSYSMSVATKKAENEKEKNPDGSVGLVCCRGLTETEQAVYLLEALLVLINEMHSSNDRRTGSCYEFQMTIVRTCSLLSVSHFKMLMSFAQMC